jgi:hypothetical protein
MPFRLPILHHTLLTPRTPELLCHSDVTPVTVNIHIDFPKLNQNFIITSSYLTNCSSYTTVQRKRQVVKS